MYLDFIPAGLVGLVLFPVRPHRVFLTLLVYHFDAPRSPNQFDKLTINLSQTGTFALLSQYTLAQRSVVSQATSAR